MRVALLKFSLLVAFSLSFNMAASATDYMRQPNNPAETLIELMGQRIVLMHPVAAWKWANNIPIEDKDREAIVLTNARQKAEAYGLDPDSTEAFFKVQIKIAKQAQQQAFDQWERDGYPFETPPDLNTHTRPKISALTEQIIAQLAIAVPHLDTAFGRYRGTMKRAWTQDLQAAFADIKYADTPQAQALKALLESGLLRVGTTGDYAPFSDQTAEGLEGIDIDLARDLAVFLGLNLELVPTSWPTLLEDLAADRYDIGMSGISIKPFRLEAAHMSAAYHTGGKTPIIRCADQDRFQSLEDIDQEDVDLVVNPGGTNERFVRANIKQADIRVFNDNAMIFNEIVLDRADVMITDAIEVTYRSAIHPDLCPAMAGETFTFSEKGYLMPQNALLRQQVNRWLADRTERGVVQRTFNRHLSASGQ